MYSFENKTLIKATLFFGVPQKYSSKQSTNKFSYGHLWSNFYNVTISWIQRLIRENSADTKYRYLSQMFIEKFKLN